MRTIALLITLSFLLFIEAGALAQEIELPGPGLTPDSPFYFIERITEAIGNFFTFGNIKKAERHAVLAAERLAEAKAVAEKGKSELAEKTIERYENQLNNSIAKAEKAQAEGEDTGKVMEVLVKVGQATSKHLEVLAEVYEKVPEQARPAIEDAIKVSVKGHERVVEDLKEQNALGEIPEEAPMSESVPQEVRERIQQRLQIEEVLEGIDSSKSAKEICAEQGGTPEMCELLPSEEFESFEEIESFCMEQGVTQEICSSLESKCREYGVTTPNECFIFLSAYSIGTFQKTSLEVSPQPLSPEIHQQIRIQRGVGETSMEAEEESIEGPTVTGEGLKQRYIPGVSKVIIYSASFCPHCTEAKDWLQQHNIEYEEIDISNNETVQKELIEKVGQLVAPIIEVGDDVLLGFTEERFSEFFGVE